MPPKRAFANRETQAKDLSCRGLTYFVTVLLSSDKWVRRINGERNSTTSLKWNRTRDGDNREKRKPACGTTMDRSCGGRRGRIWPRGLRLSGNRRTAGMAGHQRNRRLCLGNRQW